jgi:hypothetical protein
MAQTPAERITLMEDSKPIERNPEYAKSFARMHRRQTAKRILRRLGCGLVIAVWLVVMLLPCLLVTLLVQKELVIKRSDIPEDEYRLFILENQDERGFGLSRGSIVTGGEDTGEVCIITRVNYLLWEGEAENKVYCDCYEKTAGEWSAVLIGGDDECQPVPLATPSE